MNALRSYLTDLVKRFGDGWNRFWFFPSLPHTSAAMRIAVGILTLGWLVGLSFDLQTLLGPSGWLPVAKVAQWRGGRGFSLLDMIQDPTLLWIVHGLTMAVVVMFTVGLFTRVTAILSAILVLSYLWRAPMLNGAVEDLLPLLLVYLCIGPCGAVWSLDAWRRGRSPLSSTSVVRYSSLTTISMRLVQVHLTAIYVVMALAKCRGAVWWTGEAAWWMAAGSPESWFNLPWLAEHPYLISALTHAILAVQLIFPVLVWNRSAPPLMLGLAAISWSGVWLLTGQASFCLLMLAAHLAFVSPEWLSRCCGQSDASLARPQREPMRPAPLSAAR
jgi:hypothetical protein